MSRPVTFVVVGLGSVSKSWLRVFTTSEDAEPVAFVDPDSSRFTILDDAYKSVDPDAVLILTPPQYHARYEIEAMENLNHVIVEKPFCTEVNDLRHVLQKKRYLRDELDEDLTCVVNQQYRYMEPVEAMKQALWSGKVGKPGFAVSVFNEPDYPFNLWWRQQHQDISFANWYVHHIDTMRYLLGGDPERPAARPIEVSARLFRVPWSKITGESSIFMRVLFDNGVEWSYNASQEGRGEGSPGLSEFTIHCSEGTIEHPRHGGPVAWTGGRKNPVKEPIDQDYEAMGFDLPPDKDHTMALFVDAVRTGKPDPRLTTFEDNKWTIAIMFCARQSMLEGRTVNVTDYMTRVAGPFFDEKDT